MREPALTPRCTVLTLGVADVERARVFYVDGLGWPELLRVPNEAVYLRLGPTQLLCLHDAVALAAEAGTASAPTPGAVVLGHNVGSAKRVGTVLEAAAQAGAEIVSPARERAWGGVSGYFADPDGHRWEVAYNPGIVVARDGAVVLRPGS